MQHRQAQKIGESAFKRKKLWSNFFVLLVSAILVVFVSLWGIVLCKGAEVVFLCIIVNMSE